MHAWVSIILLALGAIGLVFTLYMTRVFMRVQRGEEVHCVDGACPIVMKTPDARTFGFPNFYLALPYYALLVIFASLRLAGLAPWLLVPALVLSGLALTMSGYLAWSLLVKLKQP